jgi:predicted nucleic acid-binding protein
VIVVDTNVIAYALIQGPRTELARRARALDPVWRVPALWRHEFLNILATYAREGGTTLGRATQLWEEAAEALTACEEPVDMGLALRLAVEHGVSAYDAQFVALAMGLGVVCVSADQKLLRRFPDCTRSLAAFCEA